MLSPGGPCRCSPPPALLRSPLPLSSVSPPSSVRTRSRAASSSAWWEKVPRGARWRWRGCRLASTVATRRRRLGSAVRCLAGRRTPPPSRSRRRCTCKRRPVAATAVGSAVAVAGSAAGKHPATGHSLANATARRRDGAMDRAVRRGLRRGGRGVAVQAAASSSLGPSRLAHLRSQREN